ncbi:MAG: threonine synthase [Deltaproteobacteria bacterium]|nr:threonine synthase [Deltaproteobacteria bacterium]
MLKDLYQICTNCNTRYPIIQAYPRCKRCNEPLEVELITKGMINRGDILKQTILARYRDFLPFERIDEQVSLGEGFTPLVRAGEMAKRLGIDSLFIKDETQNPTWSFKDRGTLLGVQHAIALGYKKIGTVSTGNMAVSVAAYGAKGGFKTYILVNSQLPEEKVAPITIYNPVLIRVEGDYDVLYYRSIEVGEEEGIYFVNSDVPFRVEGSKSIAYEICEQLGFDVPDYVIVPTSSGGNLRGIIKGFLEFKGAGLISRMPTFVCAQAEGCSPIVKAGQQGREKIERVIDPHTIAHAIENPNPPSGNEILRKMREYKGIFVAVSDEEILQAQRSLAGEGIFGQPAAAVPLAALQRLMDKKVITGDKKVVCIVTGSGLKDTKALEGHSFRVTSCKIDELHAYM